MAASGLAMSLVVVGIGALTDPASALPPSPYTLSVIAGTGSSGTPTQGAAAVSSLGQPEAIAMDAAGNIFVADVGAHVVEKITPDGTLSVFAGNGGTSLPTVPGIATDTSVLPEAIAVDSSGNVYVADASDHTVDKITAAGQLSIVAGVPGQAASNGSLPTPGLATSTLLQTPEGVAVDHDGNVYFSDDGPCIIDKVTAAGHLTVFAGTGNTVGAAVVPGPAINSPLYYPYQLATDLSGNVYVANEYDNDIVKITPGGTLSVIAGLGSQVYLPPVPGLAASSPLNYPSAVAVDNLGNLYITDSYNYLIEKVTPQGILSVIAGDGTDVAPTPGDALSSSLGTPYGIAVDAEGNIYYSDIHNIEVGKLALTSSAPTAPVALDASPATGDSATLTFSPPLRTGQSPITGYQYSIDGGQTWLTATVTGQGSSLSTTVPGLDPGHSYTIQLRAINVVGNGAAATATVTVPATPAAPTAPSGLHAVAGPAGKATVHFTAPTAGTSPITKYQYSTDGGHTWHTATTTGHGSTLTTTVPGMKAGHSYTIELRGVNAVGAGPAATTSVTVPATPTPTHHPKPWFVDPMSKNQRARLATTPKHLLDKDGKARLTTADYRSHNGHLAVPMSTVGNHQLAKGQAVQLTSLFAFDSATLTKAGRATLRRLAHSMHTVHRITCEGHSDYAGEYTHEMTLSQQRARTVCVALSRDLPGLHTHSVGYGRAQPVVIGGTPAQRTANRRVDVTIDR